MKRDGRRYRWSAAQCRAVGLALWLGAALGMQAGCPGDSAGGNENDNAVCGNGVREGAEACDGDDLGGQTCEDVLASANGGELLCNALCELETYACGICGDAIQTPDEGCDCGTDPADLPLHCLAENGARTANCSVYCQRRPHCGDGVVTSDEECDCGTSTHTQNLSCAGYNGEEGVSCDEQCLFIPPCFDVGDLCEPDDFPCCDDVDGQPVTCADFSPYHVCVRSCADDPECYWSTYCASLDGGICLYPSCAQIPGNPHDAFQPCNDPGPGWCVPIGTRWNREDWFYANCIESGTLAPGTSCPNVGINWVVRSVPMCDLGACVGEPGEPTGICRQFCSWADDHEAMLGFGWSPYPCPAGTNCFSTSGIDPATGIRSSDFAYCLPTAETDPLLGRTTCSLVTDQLLSNAFATCANLPIPSRCDLAQVETGDADGSLVGVCSPIVTQPTLAVWDECTAAADCPATTTCLREDSLSSPSGPFRCVPYCDTDPVVGTDCPSRGAAPGTTCVSLSVAHGPPLDVSPTRLGYCVLP